MNIHRTIKEIFNTKNKNKSNRTRNNKKIINEIILYILDFLIINKWSKLFNHLFFLVFSFTIILVTIDFYPKNSIEKQFLVILATIIFIAIGIYIGRPIGKYYNKGLYLLKVLIVLIYQLASFSALINNFSTIGLIFTVLVSIGYTSALVKNNIDIFSSLVFQYINLILVLILLNLFVIGLSFGLYYLNFNDVFKFYDEDEFQTINNGGLKYIYYVIYVGIVPFFSFPSINLTQEIRHFVPLLEFLLGYLFNLSIVAFFLSYSISKYFERRSYSEL